MLSDAWLPANSAFVFSDNYYDAKLGNDEYGTIMLKAFEQGAKKTENCKEDCIKKYELKPRNYIYRSKTVY